MYKMKEYVENKLGTNRIEIQIFPDLQLGSDVNINENLTIPAGYLPELDENVLQHYSRAQLHLER